MDRRIRQDYLNLLERVTRLVAEASMAGMALNCPRDFEVAELQRIFALDSPVWE